MRRYVRTFFKMSPADIAYYLKSVFDMWNIRVGYACKSVKSNSWYIKLTIGTKEEPRSIHIRISDHDAAENDSVFTYDVMCSIQRKGTAGITPVSYFKLLGKLASEFGRELPSLCRHLSRHQKQHSIALQKNRRNRRWSFFRGSRLYVA